MQCSIFKITLNMSKPLTFKLLRKDRRSFQTSPMFDSGFIKFEMSESTFLQDRSDVFELTVF